MKNIAKKIILSLILLLSFDSAFAHWDADIRSHCRWWRNRYMANTSVYDWQYNRKTCEDGWKATNCNDDKGVRTSGNCIMASAEAWAKRGSLGGWSYRVASGYAGNFNLDAPSTKFPGINSVVLTNTERDASAKNIFTTGGTVFDEVNNTITINKIYVKLHINTVDIQNEHTTIALTVGREFPEGDSVSTEFPEVYLDSRASIVEGQLLLTGIFENIEFTYSESYDSGTGKFERIAEGRLAEVTLPLNPELEVTNLVVRLSGDCGDLQMGQAARFGVDPTKAKIIGNKVTDEQLNAAYPISFEAFPNPVQDVFTIQIKLREDKKITGLHLINSEGVLVKNIAVKYKSRCDDKLKVGNLPKGIYYLVLTAGDQKWSRKIIKH